MTPWLPAVFAVFQLAGDHVGDDLHFTVRVQRKAARRGDHVIVEDPQRTK